MRKFRLVKAFSMFAKQSVIYKRAVMESSELKSVERVANYQEFPIPKCVIKTAKPSVQGVTEETHYGLRLNVIFLSEDMFIVSFHDRVCFGSAQQPDEYRITDFKNLEQLPGFHKTVLEIEKL